MVFDANTVGDKTRLTAFLTAHLTPEQLDAVQTAFGRGSFSQGPECSTELFIKDEPHYHGLGHADIRRAETGGEPFLVIDEKTPDDGGIWYIDDFAAEDEVEDEMAENTNVLWKIRMKIEDVPIMHANYAVANASIREDLDELGVDYPAPENYEQDGLHTSGLDPDEATFMAPVFVTVEPGEYEESTDPLVLETFSPPEERLYRLKPDIAQAHGLRPVWTVAGTASPHTLPDGSTRDFPEGSIRMQMFYDPDSLRGSYQRPEGSL